MLFYTVLVKKFIFMILLAVLLQEVVDKHSDKEVLETCAKTLERLCDDRHAIYSRCDIARSRLLDMVSHHMLHRRVARNQ